MPMSQYTALLKVLPAVPGVRLDVQPLPAVAQALVKVRLPHCGHSSAMLSRPRQKVRLTKAFVVLSQVSHGTQALLTCDRIL